MQALALRALGAAQPGWIRPATPPAGLRAPLLSARTRRKLLGVTALKSGGGAGGANSSGGHGRAPRGDRGGGAQAERALRALGAPDRIGSEYGEGFIQFRLSGERIHLDVEALNEQLRSSGADRMRHALRPDEAFGLIFNWDGVVADTRSLQGAAWRALAAEEGLPPPRPERLAATCSVPPERAVTEVLGWTRDWGRARALSWRLAELYAEALAGTAEALPGVRAWLERVHRNNVPCALVTSMDRTTTGIVLERLGLAGFFSAAVTANDDMETIAQRYLSAAIKLGRPPEQCVVFAACPATVAAAHNCTMRAVAVLGTHKGWQLKSADLAVSSLSELSVYNLRRLFANKGSEFMDVRRAAPDSRSLWGRRRLTHATADPDDG